MDEAVSAEHNAREFDEWEEKKQLREMRLEKLLTVIWRAWPDEVKYAENGIVKSFTITWRDDEDMGDLL